VRGFVWGTFTANSDGDIIAVALQAVVRVVSLMQLLQFRMVDHWCRKTLLTPYLKEMIRLHRLCPFLFVQSGPRVDTLVPELITIHVCSTQSDPMWFLVRTHR